MRTNRLLSEITQLQTSGPRLLRMGSSASSTRLASLITWRTRIAIAVVAKIHEREPEPLFRLLAADHACVRHAPTLLYLSDLEAVAAAVAGGGALNGMSWAGIHRWDMVMEAVPKWTGELSAVVGRPLHRAVVTQSIEDLRILLGPTAANEALVAACGAWRAQLPQAARAWLADRAALIDQPEQCPC